ncbi:MAG: metallopeptidase TldD-related protein, partial [Myxococcota bacterium]
RVAFEVRMESGDRYGRSFALGPNLESIDVEGAVDTALDQALEGGPPAVLPPGRYPAVLDRSAVARLFKVLGNTAGVAAKSRGESFLVRSGEQIFDDRLHVIDDFTHALHRGEPFDCDGLAREIVPLVESGMVGRPVSGWFNRGQLAPTGHGVVLADGRRAERAEHLVVSGGGSGDWDRLVRGVHAGVLVSDFNHLEVVDPAALRVTGVTGPGFFAIEAGERTVPLLPLRFDVSLYDLFANLPDLGAPGWAEGAVVPPLCVAELPLYAPA